MDGEQILHFSAYAAVSAFAIQNALKASFPLILGWGGLGILALLCLLVHIRFMIQRSNLPPGSVGLPLLGHFLDYVKHPKEFYAKYIQKYGTFFTVNYLMMPAVSILDDDDMRWLMKEERKGHLRPTSAPHIVQLLGSNSILMTHGKRHRLLRRMLEPAFTPGAVNDYASLLNSSIEQQLKEWSNEKDFIDLEEVKSATLKIFFHTVFGEPIDDQILPTLLDDFGLWLAGFKSVPIQLPGTSFSKAMAARKRLIVTMQDKIVAFKDRYPESSHHAQTTLGGRLCYCKDEDGTSELSLPDQAEMLVLLSFAAHDTTHATIGNLFHNYMAHPDLIELVRKEVDALDLDSVEDIKNKAPVLNAFIFESWRLDAPVNGSGRKLINGNDAPELHGYRFAKGTVFGLHYRMAGFNASRYPKPEEFRLERYLPPDHELADAQWLAQDVDPNKITATYRVFGCGNHSCIGQHFARLEVRLFLAQLVRDYTLQVRNETLVPFLIWHWSSQFRLTARSA